MGHRQPFQPELPDKQSHQDPGLAGHCSQSPVHSIRCGPLLLVLLRVELNDALKVLVAAVYIVLIFSLLLLTRADHEDSVTKIIRAGCYILSIFAFPISLLAICGIIQSKKDLIKAYVISLFEIRIISVFVWICVAVVTGGVLSGFLISTFLWYRYSMNMLVIQMNIM